MSYWIERISSIGVILLITIGTRCGSRDPTLPPVQSFTTSRPSDSPLFADILDVNCPNEVFDDVPSTSHLLSQLYATLELPNIVVIQDKQSAEFALQDDESDTPTIVSHYEISPESTTEDINQVLEIHNKLSIQSNYFLVLCNINCTVELLNEVNRLDRVGPTQGVLTHLVHWMVLLHKEDSDAMKALGENVANITHLTAIVNVDNGSLHENAATHRIYSASWAESGRQFEEVGRYQKGRLVLQAPLFPNEHYGFNNRTFTITVNMWGPFLSKIAEGNSASYYGMCIDMLETIAIEMNFSYVLVEPSDGKWGTIDNGTWEGIVAQLYNKEVDISIAPLAVSTLRESVVDFTFPFYLEYTTVLYAQQQKGARTLGFFFQPFHWMVWVLLGLAMFATALAITKMACVSPAEPPCGLKTAHHSLWFTLGAFFNQSSVHNPMAQSTRMIVGFFWFFCTVLVATYGANLVAFLTVTKTKAPFTTLEELAHQNEYAVGVIGGTIWEEMLQSSAIHVYKRIWDKILHDKSTNMEFDVLDQSTARHVERAKHKTHAVVTDITTLQLAREKNCDILMMDEKFLPLRYAIALQNNSAYRTLISNVVMRLLESGLMDFWHQKYWPRTDFCITPGRQMARSIGVEDLLGVFIVVLVFVGLGAVVLCTEIFISRRASQNVSNSYPTSN